MQIVIRLGHHTCLVFSEQRIRNLPKALKSFLKGKRKGRLPKEVRIQINQPTIIIEEEPGTTEKK